jgi:ribosomal protein S18 acetylase RimI-like enzyme
MIRRAGAQDVPFLRDMLRHAYYWRTVAEEETPLAAYVEAWGRPGDRAVVALEGANRVGAAWYRVFNSRRPGYGFVDERTPELTIAVVPSRRGKGYGHELLEALLEQARKDGFAAVSLSVDRENPAVKLYERYGFRKVAESEDAYTMKAELGSVAKAT